MSGLTVGSLFAGVGGFDLAAERAGMTVVWQSEYDKHASAVLDDHWPDIPNYGDIHAISIRRDGAGVLDAGNSATQGRRREQAVTPINRDRDTQDGDIHDIRLRPCERERGGSEPSQLRNLSDTPGGRDEQDTVGGDDGGTDDRIYAAGVDVLVGGFPCQDYSVAGQRGGLAGDRGALWWQFHRLITEGRPRWVVGENVPGLLSSRSGQDFGVIVDSLTELGYRVAWRVLDAQYFGVAQRRRRVFIVASLGAGNPSEVLAIAEGLSGHPQPGREEGTVTSALTANGLGGGGPDDNNAQANTLIPVGAFRWQENRNDVRLDDPTTTLTVQQTQAVAIQGTTIGRSDTAGPGGKGWDDTGAMFTLETVAPHAVATTQVRRLTPLECERLQGFPDQWTASQSDTQRYRQMGNAVAVPVAEWIMQRISVLH